jgi:hypothetical protein
MKRGKSTGKPTKEEQTRLDELHAMPCVCCELLGCRQPSPTEVHHLVDKGYRKHSGGHSASLPLCGWHHRGEDQHWPTRKMLVDFGPSLARSKRDFTVKFGSERELLAKVDIKLSLAIPAFLRVRPE